MLDLSRVLCALLVGIGGTVAAFCELVQGSPGAALGGFVVAWLIAALVMPDV